MDAGWKFHLGDIPAPIPNTHLAAYMANKAGWSGGAARRNYDDSDWRLLDVPHDWSVEGQFDPQNHVDAGFLPRGIAWYRRHFRLEETDRGKYLALQFDGIATHCTLYVNGYLLARNYCGYTPLTINISDIASFGDQLNVVAVRVDATYMEGWWYEGAGIYRHVWLTKTSGLHFAPYGVFVQPKKEGGDTWETQIESTLVNDSDDDRQCSVDSTIYAPDGQVAGQSKIDVRLARRSSLRVTQSIRINSPPLWSLTNPRLCRCTTQLRDAGKLLDELSTRFGYRTLRFDPDQGFFLNDQAIKLKGTCNHQDHAGVGVAVPDTIHAFRIRRLLEMGTNAYRCAHHPPAPELLDACDELGMLVMDESRNFGSSPEHLDQLRTMVLRDRNHPCVVLWSICNEETIQGTSIGANIARTMQAFVRELDPSRPVTAAVSGGILNDDCIADSIDVTGINYQLATYASYHAKHPKTPLLASETHCALTTRGIYHTDPDQHVFDSYDEQKAFWGTTAREAWSAISSQPFVAGLFAWTGFDYRGEPSPHHWPSVNSHWGILDMCGFPKDSFHLHKAFFTREPFVHLLPHWNWLGKENEPIRVMAYSNCETAELFLNGQSLGEKRVDPIDMAEWLVPYAPGTLRAIAAGADSRVVETTLQTTDSPFALGLELDQAAILPVILADGQCALPVSVFATDSSGRRVPTAGDLVTFSITGPAKILGVGNGDPNCHEADKAYARSLFHGLAQVIVQTTLEPGPFTVHASAAGLRFASLKFQSLPAPNLHTVAPAQPRYFLEVWRMSPISPNRPDPHQSIAEQDMNTWESINPANGPQKQWQRAKGYALYRTTAKLPKFLQTTGGQIVFNQIIGSALFFLGRDEIASKPNPAAAQFQLPIAPTTEKLTLTVLLHTDSSPAGLTQSVELLPAVPPG